MQIGVDIGGSGLRAALVRRGETLGQPLVMRHDRSVGSVLRAVEEVGCRLGPYPIGVAVPGYVERGVVRASPNFPTWRDVDLRTALMRRLRRPVYVCNDADAAALGVALALGVDDVAVLTLGTGVGGGIVVEGRLLPGRATGELGHVWIGGEERCGCGARGCLETVVGLVALERRAAVLGLDGDLCGWSTLPPSHPLWAPWVEGLARGMRALVCTVGPRALALLGGLTVAGAAIEAAVARFREEVIPVHRGVPVHLLGRADRYAIVGATAVSSRSDRRSPRSGT